MIQLEIRTNYLVFVIHLSIKSLSYSISYMSPKRDMYCLRTKKNQGSDSALAQDQAKGGRSSSQACFKCSEFKNHCDFDPFYTVYAYLFRSGRFMLFKVAFITGYFTAQNCSLN